ncbi:MAG TPA: PAS domain S-box protein [Stellaceae bacterium]|nr:PAS domain S-box protein [Stellaceae bacterium]
MDNSLETLIVGAAATIAVFSVASVLYVDIKRRIRLDGAREALVVGIFFGLCAASSMLIPLRLLPGMPVDGAPVAIALAAPFGGGLAIAVAATLAAALRLWLGGAAPLAGIAEVALAALAGLFVNLIAERLQASRARRVLALALVLPSAGYVGLALRWPAVTGHEADAAAIIEMSAFLVLGTLAFGALLLRQMSAEQKLADSDGRFEALAANVPGIVFQCAMQPSGEFSFSHLSGHLAEFFGTKSEEVETNASNILRMIHPEDLEAFRRSLREAGADLALWSHDFRMIDPGGGERWVRGRARPRSRPAGSVVWHGAMVEVTRRKQREEAQRRIERHYRLIAETSSDVMQITAADGTLSYVSPSAARLFGYPVAELVGRPADALLHAADVESVRAARHQAGIGGKPVTVSCRLRRKDGAYVAVTETCRPADEADAEGAGETISIIRAASAQTAVTGDERPFARTLEAMGAGVLITDPNAPDNPIVFANTAATIITGYSVADLIGRNLRMLQGPDTDSGAADALGRAMAEERPAVVTWFNHRRDGTSFRSRLHMNPIHNARKQLQAFVAVFFDLGGAEAVASAAQAPPPTDDALSSFVSMLTQELRTPLGGVIGFSDLLLEGALAPEQRRYATSVRNAGRSIRAIIDNAIDLAAIDTVPAIAETAFSIAELALSCSSVVWQAAREKKLELNFVMKPDVIDAVRGHPDRIRHALLDLLDDAVRSTDNGAVTLTVARLEDREGKTAVRFAVIDSRAGNAAEGEPEALGAARTMPPICRALVERMGGTAGAAATPAGNVFWFALALMPADGAVERPRARRRARILLAEDTAMSQELVLAVLTRAGHEVEVVGDGAAAVEAIRKRAFDLVLLDLQMPQMDGIKAAQAIRGMPGRAKDVPIVALTARASSKDAERCRAAGMNDHVAKPISAGDLVALVDRWLETRPAEQDAPRRRTAARPPLVDKLVHENAVEALEQHLGPDKAAQMVDAAIKEIPERLERMLRQVSDRGRIAEDANELVAVAGNLGFNELRAQCRRLAEINGEADDWQVGVMVENAKTAAERAIAAMRRAERYVPSGMTEIG